MAVPLVRTLVLVAATTALAQAAYAQAPIVATSPTHIETTKAGTTSIVDLRLSIAKYVSLIETGRHRDVRPLAPFRAATRAVAQGSGSTRSTARRRLGAVVGATAGLLAGGFGGAQIESHACGCRGAGFKGFFIGAPIGAVIGGIAGSKWF